MTFDIELKVHILSLSLKKAVDYILINFNIFTGESLGKNNDGITKPIKAHRKTNLSGLGADQAKDITGGNWWERVYNDATNNVLITNETNGDVVLSKKEADGVEITNKNYSSKKLKNKSNSITYGNFLKAATLQAGVKETDIPGHIKIEDIQFAPAQLPTDEELFKV